MHNTDKIKTEILKINTGIVTLKPEILFHLFYEDKLLLNTSLDHILVDCEPLKSFNSAPIELELEPIAEETDLELSKGLLAELDLTDLETFLMDIGEIINTAYYDSDLDITSFITERKASLPTVLLNMVASEQAFGVDPNLMDDLVEVRTNLLNMDIIATETKDVYANFEAINDDIEYLNNAGEEYTTSQGYSTQGLTFKISNKSLLEEKFKDIFLLYQETIKILLCEVDHTYEKMKERIEEIDQIVQEIPKLVGTAGLFTKLTPKKQIIAANNYGSETIEHDVAETYIHFSNLENNPSKNMQDTLLKMKELKQYDSRIQHINLG